MELERVKGNTWVLKSWELIPLYQVDDTRCILLDTGTVDQRAELEAARRWPFWAAMPTSTTWGPMDIFKKPGGPSWL